ncbi:MAG: hypothetical protein J7549_00735 [Variovorax sp.]|nr:hypothetical protein [Variovorax sp.]
MNAARRFLAAGLAAFVVACGVASAAPLALAPAPAVRFDPEPGAALPLHLPMQTSRGVPATLDRYFDGQRTVVLVPGYYGCTQLCGLVMHGLLEALGQSGLPASAWRVVGFSLDADDTPATARPRESDDLAYARFLASNGRWRGDAPPAIDLLTAGAPAIQTLSRALGIESTRAADRSIDHAAGFVVVTPDGRIARHFSGVSFEPRDLRLALVEASQGRVGTLPDRLVLLCSHYDPAVGRYTVPLMLGLRVLGVLGVLAGGTWLWRRRHAGGGDA